MEPPLLHIAAYSGHLDVVRVLVERGFDVNLRDKSDNAYAIHYAAEMRHLEIVKLLADAGGDVHGPNTLHELDVLGWATCFQHVRQDVANELLRRGTQQSIFSAVALGRAEDVRRMIQQDRSLLVLQLRIYNCRYYQ